ncbi:MAG: prepilin peptidase [Deltaproteobacteria bacterium]|nr:prepilin peptidase [Deltaproteobacteria bacterium]
MDALFYIAFFAIGAALGSFLNVCILRIPEGRSIVYPPSNCPACNAVIRFYDNIPIVSYILLSARCRQCLSPISAQYPLVEAITAALTLFLYAKFGLSIALFINLVFVLALIVITFIDLRLQIIPDVISIPGIISGFLFSFFTRTPGVAGSLLGIIIGGGILLVIAFLYFKLCSREGMGGGDIKLLAMIGAFVGWKGVLFVLFTASLTGAFIGSLFLFFSGSGRDNPIPFGPFLAIGALIYVFAGEFLGGLYFSFIWA